MDALERYRLPGVQETGRELGRGSFTTVVELDYKGLLCAGKKVHRGLLTQGAGSVLRRFEDECKLLSKLQHPRIAQFLGVYFEPETNVPVLVMEFIPHTLAECLDTYGILPEEISYSVLRDVAMALHYLHDRPQPIAHCSLSANNVLLTGDAIAKITDIGITSLVHSNSTQTSELPHSPGMYFYTPPEMLAPGSDCDSKVDVFSYGVMMVHVFSGCWPLPKEPAKSEPCDPSHPHIPVSEADRREEYLNDMGRDHPLMELILGCLRNDPASRPESVEILHRVGKIAARFPSSFSDRVEMLQRIASENDQKEVLRAESQRSRRIQEATEGKLVAHSVEVEELKIQLAGARAELNSVVAQLEAKKVEIEAEQLAHQAKAIEMSAIREELLSKNAAIGGLTDQLDRARACLSSSTSQPSLFPPEGKLIWSECESLPVPMGLAQTVMMRGNVYLGGGGTEEAGEYLVFEYAPDMDEWNILPRSPVKHFGVGQLMGRLALVGGRLASSTHAVTADVHFFDEDTRQWVKSIPPMPTARFAPAVVSCPTALIACGGMKRGEVVLATVEVYRTDSSQWYTVDPLPSSRVWMSVVTVGDHCFLSGGYETWRLSNTRRSILCASIASLVENASSQPARNEKTGSPWKTLPDTPNYFSTATTMGGCLLAVGGSTTVDFRKGATKASIHAYIPGTSSWVRIGNLMCPRDRCITALLPSGELLIVGGGERVEEEWVRRATVFRGSIQI